jgi:RNA polymerase-binding protein DksA
MTLTKEILAELKEKLLEEKTRIQTELDRIGKPTTKEGDYSTNFSEMGEDEDENASEVEEYTDNLALEANLEKQLKEILEALEKMESGTYGKCENCNTDISIERLRAYPAAKTCITC